MTHTSQRIIFAHHLMWTYLNGHTETQVGGQVVCLLVNVEKCKVIYI